MVNIALTNGARTSIREILNTVFNGPGTRNLEFVSSSFGPNSSTVASTYIPNSQFPLDYRIICNEDKMPNASLEYGVATIYHEILHTYLMAMFPSDATGKLLIGNGHDFIAYNYINMLKEDLKNTFPGLSDDDARGHAWGGLGGTTLWTLQDQNEQILINSVNVRYRTRPSTASPSNPSSGTSYCNP